MSVYAVVTAGGIPRPGEPLYPYTLGRPKALLEVAGRSMVHWVLEALERAQVVRRVVVVGLPATAAPAGLTKPLDFMPNRGAMLENIVCGLQRVLEHDANAQAALIVGSDIPAVTPESLDWLAQAVEQTEYDFYYSIIRRETMDQHFPGARRSQARLRDGTFTGGDAHGVALRLVRCIHPAWQRLIAARKSVLKQAALIGPAILLRLVTGRLTLAEAEAAAGQRLGVRARALICPYAELGMDVDKPGQHEILNHYLAKRRPA